MIAILGGGISGLAAAYELHKQNKEFILLEASDQLGGKIQSKQQGGFLLEMGPNTVLINNLEIKQLLDDLDLSNQVIQPDEEAVKNRFVTKDLRPQQIPNSLASAIQSPLFNFHTLFNLLKEPIRKKREINTEESLADFSRRRFGKQIFEDYITPFITGIYAGDPEKMSINHTLQILKEAEENHGSVIRGMIRILKARKHNSAYQDLPKQKIFTFKEGLKQLVDSIELVISESVKIQASVERIEYNESQNNYHIIYAHQNKSIALTADSVISTIPANQLADLCSEMDPKFSLELKKINYVPALVLHLTFPTSAIDFKQKAFGILGRKAEKIPFLGILFNSRFFSHTAPVGQELITVICGGYHRPDLINQNEKEIHREIDDSLQTIIGLKGRSKLLNIVRWPSGIPQYELGYGAIKKSIEDFQKTHKNFNIAGNYYGGISVSDCISNGMNIARKLI